MIKVYGFPGTRSSRVQWLLEEANVPYELVVIDLLKGEHKQPEHLARHVHGLVPVLEDGPVRLIESAAMCMHVADANPQAKLAPPVGTPERARYYEHVVYAVSTLDESAIPLYLQERFVPEDKRDTKLMERARETLAKSCEFLERELGAGPFLLGDQFSAADVAVGYDLALAAQVGVLKGHDALERYVARLVERPAFRKAHPRP